jgi:two-component system response regulator AtoC
VHAKANAKPGFVLQPEARAVLALQPWPGNIRQLENFVERLIVLSDSPTITSADVLRELARTPGIRPAAEEAPVQLADQLDLELASRVRRSEREALLQALAKANDNRTVAARLLGVSRRTLYTKLEEHGLL